MGSYGNNIDISSPGSAWQMLWPDDFSNIQLDIVGFLAILGEQSILANAQVSALSRLFLLPRLLPAPQALLRVSRPDTLRPVQASVVSVLSGNKIDHIHHVASILLHTSEDELPKHSVRCVRVTKQNESAVAKRPTLFDRFFRGLSKKDDKPTVRAKAAGPLTFVTLLGVLLTLVIIILSFCYGDGMSLMAAISLSLLSTVAGVANKWELTFAEVPGNACRNEEDDMVVIRYPTGSFLVVKSDEHIRRELFFAPEEIKYTIKSATTYRILALIGSVLLMLGVILLANARLELQLAWAGAYVLLNIVHWAAAALPAKMHWDLSYYKVQEESIDVGPSCENFTEALWKAILLTREKAWVRNGGAAPNTPVWDKWLELAVEAARSVPRPNSGTETLTEPIPAWSADGKGIVHRAPVFDAKAQYNKLADKASEKRKEEQEKQEREPTAHNGYPKEASATATAVSPVSREEVNRHMV